MCEKSKSASPSDISKGKNRRNSVNIDENLDVIGRLENGKQLSTYGAMLGALVLAYVQ